jgi:hypothetical protein
MSVVNFAYFLLLLPPSAPADDLRVPASPSWSADAGRTDGDCLPVRSRRPVTGWHKRGVPPPCASAPATALAPIRPRPGEACAALPPPARFGPRLLYLFMSLLR